MANPMDDLGARILGHALARGLVSASQFQAALVSGQEPLAFLQAEGVLEDEDLDLLRGMAQASEAGPFPDAPPGSSSAGPGDSLTPLDGQSVWDSQPASGISDSGRQVHRVLALEAWKHYRNLRFVAEGGMGRVFKAFDARLKRVVALKFLQREDPDLVKRFVLEAQNQAKVEHPNICKVYEVGEWQGQSYIAMQFVKGETLEAAAPGLSLTDRVKVMEAVAEAIHAAHRQGLIHRDLKPANIMVELEDHGPKPTILDFGLAKGLEATGLTVQGLVIGTTHYMAPEQATGDHDKVGRRTDVYGLGATLHRVLTGRPPFAGTEGMDVVRRTVEEDVPSLTRLVPDLPEDLDTIVRKCMEKDPARRYESALAVAEDLRRWREGEPILARRPTLRYRVGKWAGRHRLVVGVGAAGLAVALTFAWVAVRARFTAAAQARWGQHFTQGAERMEALVRYIHLSPAHDLTGELAQLHENLRAMKEDMARAGRQGQGPGAYALGRAHLVLGELDAAQQCLEEAERLGFTTPEAQYALGRVLSQQYQRGVQQVQQVADAGLRAARLKALEAQLARALACLKRGQGNALEPLAYQEGLLALFARRFDEAIAKAEAARVAAPWFYEALALQAEAHMVRAREGSDSVARSRDLAAADAALQQALRHAPSDPHLLEHLAQRWSDEMRLAWDMGQDLEPLAQAQLEFLHRWTVLVPGDLGPRTAEGWTQAELAKRDGFQGRDPGPRAAAAKALADGVLKAFPKDAHAHAVAASALRAEGDWKLVHGGDPTSVLLEALEHCRAGLASSPAHPLLLETAPKILVPLIEYRSASGQDLDSTDALLQGLFTPQALAGEAGPFLSLQLAAIHIELAEADVQRDRDPRPRLQMALDLLEQGHGQVGDPFESQLRRGNAHIVGAEYLQGQGVDPTPEAEAAATAYRAAMALNPKRYDAAWGLAETHLLKARHTLHGKGDPSADLARSREALDLVGILDPTNWSRDWGWAESRLLEARWLRHQQRDPEPALRQALAHAQKALALNGRRPELWVLAARIHRFRYVQLKGGGAEELLAAQALEKALALDPRNREALKERARLQARSDQSS